MSSRSRHAYNEIVKRLIVNAQCNAINERAIPGQYPDRQPIPHYRYDEKNPACLYCGKSNRLRVGRLPLTGTVAFCPDCRGFYEYDKIWEAG